MSKEGMIIYWTVIMLITLTVGISAFCYGYGAPWWDLLHTVVYAGIPTLAAAAAIYDIKKNAKGANND